MICLLLVAILFEAETLVSHPSLSWVNRTFEEIEIDLYECTRSMFLKEEVP